MKIIVQPNSASFLGRILYGISSKGLSSLPRKAASLIRQIRKQLQFRPYVHDVAWAGERVKFHIADMWAERWYVIDGNEIEASWIKTQLSDGDLFVDCGAHHGMYSLLASRWVAPRGNVIAIEALPMNAATIRRNLSLNSAENVRVENVAMSDHDGTTYVEHQKFGFLRDSNGVLRDDPHSGTVEIRCTTIDKLLNGAKPKLLKVDVEGQEINVLMGARNTLATRPSINIEIHCGLWDDPASNVKRIFELLSIHEYQGKIQLFALAPLIPFDPAQHTPEFIGQHVNVHLFLEPKGA